MLVVLQLLLVILDYVFESLDLIGQQPHLRAQRAKLLVRLVPLRVCAVRALSLFVAELLVMPKDVDRSIIDCVLLDRKSVV